MQPPTEKQLAYIHIIEESGSTSGKDDAFHGTTKREASEWLNRWAPVYRSETEAMNESWWAISHGYS